MVTEVFLRIMENMITVAELFENKYRIKSIRLPNYDYSSDGAYYITICTKNREHFFGKIINGEMVLSEIGGIVKYEWKQTGEIRKNVELDEYVIMPNHIHGILFIKTIQQNIVTVETPRRGVYNATPAPMQNAATVSIPNPHHNPQWKSNSLGSIICHFKSAVTRWCRQNGDEYFAWQSRFYEHVIRNELDLNIKRKYIVNNPLKWELDRNNKKLS